MPGVYLPEGYKQSTRERTEGVATTGQVSPKGTVTHRDHWDGRVDATVRPATFVMRMGSHVDPAHIVAAAAVAEAAKEVRLARESGHLGWVRHATERHQEAMRRLQETQ